MSEPLLPCPFCGGPAAHQGKQRRVKCAPCLVWSVPERTWNQRAALSPMPPNEADSAAPSQGKGLIEYLRYVTRADAEPPSQEQAERWLKELALSPIARTEIERVALEMRAAADCRLDVTNDEVRIWATALAVLASTKEPK